MKPPPAEVGHVLEHFRSVTPCNSGWTAACGACLSPDSVGITMRHDLIVVACSAGCAQVDVLAAAGITYADLRIERVA